MARTPAASASSSAARTQVYELRRGATGGSSNKPVLPVENSSSTTEGVNSCGSAKAGAAIDGRAAHEELAARRHAQGGGGRGDEEGAETGHCSFCSDSVPPTCLLIQSLAAVRGRVFCSAAQSGTEIRRCRHSSAGHELAQPRVARPANPSTGRKSRVFCTGSTCANSVQGSLRTHRFASRDRRARLRRVVASCR